VEALLGTRIAARLRAVDPLSALSSAVIVGGAVLLHACADADDHVKRVTLGVAMTVFFAVQIVRLVVVIVKNPTQRTSAAVLLGAVTLWSLGGLLGTTVTALPGVGEFLGVAAYLVLAAYLVFDSGASLRRSLTAWLDVVVICGAVVCLASGVLLLPAAARYESDGPAVLLALTFPLFDVLFAMLVLAQVLLRLRRGLLRAAQISVAFLLLAYADVHFIGAVSSGEPAFSWRYDAAWAAGLALLVGTACRPAAMAVLTPPPRYGGWIVGSAIAVAVTMLALSPPGHLGLYVAIPAAITLFAAGARLVAALHEAQQAVDALAKSHTDDLTRLPNRRALRSRIDAAFGTGAPIALMVLDLDGFKEINDTLGHSTGDHILEQVGRRIRAAVPPHALVARLGGDEFGVLIRGADVAEMTEAAHEVVAALSRPLRVDGIDLALSASVGIVGRADEETYESNELVRRAEVAMYRAKHARFGVAIYDPFHDDFSKAKLRIAEELRRGIANGELEVWYQPQIDASTMRPCGLEALVRWRHPIDGLLAPVAFLPGARRAGLMPLLSQEVVRLAVADIARWHAAGLNLRVAINCAPPELLSGVLVPYLHQAMKKAQLPPNLVVLEVTEESFIAEPERAREILEEVRDHGIQLSIDDYGTGFSSLGYLRDLPLDELKLDRSFVSPIGSDERSRMIVKSTVQMARALGLRTVAEGVEDAATAADLIAMGVDALQGYHISRPIPAGEVLDWMVQWPSFADLRLTARDALRDDSATRSRRGSEPRPRPAPPAGEP
jgi:diguanylate cyclase (GGDEF)-like protein